MKTPLTPPVVLAQVLLNKVRNAEFALRNWDDSCVLEDAAVYIANYLTEKKGLVGVGVHLSNSELEVICTQSVHFTEGASFGLVIEPKQTTVLKLSFEQSPTGMLVGKEVIGRLSHFLPVTMAELLQFVSEAV